MQLSDIVNLWSPTGDLPLDLALSSHNESIAATLVQHNADINIRETNGDTLLHRAIMKEDSFSALFLLENNCDATLTTRSVFLYQITVTTAFDISFEGCAITHSLSA